MGITTTSSLFSITPLRKVSSARHRGLIADCSNITDLLEQLRSMPLPGSMVFFELVAVFVNASRQFTSLESAVIRRRLRRMTRHLRSLLAFLHEFSRVLDLLSWLKNTGALSRSPQHRSVGLMFSKPSTRTRVSFEVGVGQLGGQPPSDGGRHLDLQVGRGESHYDTAKVLSRYLDGLVVRTLLKTDQLADPVVNALTDAYHPCRLGRCSRCVNTL